MITQSAHLREAKRQAALVRDPFPAGMTPEQIGGTAEPGDWDSFEPNTYNGD